MIGFLSLFCFILSAIFWSGGVSVHSSICRVIAVFLILPMQIILVGQCLALLDLLSNPSAWALASLILLVMGSMAWKRKSGSSITRFFHLVWRGFREELRAGSRFTQTAFWMLFGTLFAVVCLNLFSLCTALPHNWDSVASHLTRAAYYLQFGNMEIFHANYWAHDGHAHNAAVLWVYVLGILDTERFTQAIQFFAYVGAGLVVYGLARELGTSRLQGAVSGLIFLLLVENILESTTVQNDMIQAFFSGAGIYFLLRSIRTGRFMYLVLSVLGIFSAIGVKASFVMHVPVWAAFFVYAVVFRKELFLLFKEHLRQKIVFCLVLAPPAFLLLGDGIGYGRNYQAYGHPMGPEIARKMSFENSGAHLFLLEGSKNLLRYGFDFVSLDGLNHVPGVSKAEVALKRKVLDLLREWGIDLESGFMHVPFAPTKPTSDEDFSWWGIMGILLTPVGIGLALGKNSKHSRLLLTFLIAGVLFILVQAYIGPYKPWRGRYFIFLTLLWAPFLSEVFFVEKPGVVLKGFGLSVLTLGCLSALLCVVFRDALAFGHGVGVGRLEQLTARSENPAFKTPYIRFDQLVPQDATVLLCLFPDTFEYLYFGEKRTRTILPIRTWRNRRAEYDPPDYLVYHYLGNPSLHLCPPREKDVNLGENTYLRKLSTQADISDLMCSKKQVDLQSYTNTLHMRFHLIPAGCFLMGDNPDEVKRPDNEKSPAVCISKPFYMQTSEVTQEQWRAVMGENPAFHQVCEDCPVENVSWNDVQEFIRVLNHRGEGRYRLPTEAEWEYAARAGKERSLPGGPVTMPEEANATLERVGWYAGNAGGNSHPVASLRANAWGLHDMLGNVWEWCGDWYGPRENAPFTDPTGPTSGKDKIVKGGSFDNAPFYCRSNVRNAFPPGHKGANLGFRLVYATGEKSK